MNIESKAQFLKLYKKLVNNYQKSNYFLVEGIKSIIDIKVNFEIVAIALTQDVYKKHFSNITLKKLYICSSKEINSVSSYKNNKVCIAIAKKKKEQVFEPKEKIIPVFENLNNPGNLGTIIRTSSWFGIKQIVCINNSVNKYNYKCVQATMGSLGHVDVFYLELEDLKNITEYQFVGTSTKGIKLEKFKMPSEKIFLFFGNEAKGLSDDIINKTKENITVPYFNKGAESLNVSTSYGIIIYNLLV